jgi:hypothetical protein
MRSRSSEPMIDCIPYPARNESTGSKRYARRASRWRLVGHQANEGAAVHPQPPVQRLRAHRERRHQQPGPLRQAETKSSAEHAARQRQHLRLAKKQLQDRRAARRVEPAPISCRWRW